MIKLQNEDWLRHRRAATMRNGDPTISDLPDKLQQFLVRYIHSIWELDLLLLLKRENRAMRLSEIAKALYMDPSSISSGLNQLADDGLIEKRADKSESYSYRPNEDVSAVINELEVAYLQKRLQVVNLIFAKPLYNFSNAFKLKQEE